MMASEGALMRGKVCMITGASSGIGKETAKALARMGATVVMVGKSSERGEGAKREILTQFPNASLELMAVDFSTLEAVRGLASDFTSRHQELHVLMNNAGTIPAKREVSTDGFEMQFAVNHLAPFLLTNLLLDVIKLSAPARIVNTSSGIHNRGKIDFDNLQAERGYSLFGAYGRSKLANVLFTYELAQRLKGTGVTANCFTPGMTKTDLGRHIRGPSGFFFRHMGKSQEEGARTAVYLASSPEVEGVTGKYFSNCREVQSSNSSHDEGLAKRLWEVSERLTGLS
jgi:NAD(P)-dependent dehydrogenase (short-subunit alcohol dehydrogenase family)